MKLKIIIAAVVLLIAAGLLRLAVNELAAPSSLAFKAQINANLGDELPDGDWQQRGEALVADDALELGYKPLPEKHVGEVKVDVAKPVLGKHPVQEVLPLTAEQVLPEIAALLAFAGNELERRQALARFVQEAEISIAQIQSAVQDLQQQKMGAERKQAYKDMATQKLSAIRELRQKALEADPELLYLPFGVQGAN